MASIKIEGLFKGYWGILTLFKDKGCRYLSQGGVPPSLIFQPAVISLKSCLGLLMNVYFWRAFRAALPNALTGITFVWPGPLNPHPPTPLPSFPQHVTILSTSSSSMACIIRHRRRRGAPQKEAGAHTKTFAFWHLIRVVIARQRKPPAPRYLASFLSPAFETRV